MVTDGYKRLRRVTPKFFASRNCWRVRVPASESGTGRGIAKYFRTEEEAALFIREHHRTGSVQLAELSVHERHVLGLIRQSADYTPDLLLDAWRDFQPRQRTRGTFAITQLCEAFYVRQVKEKRSARTLNDDRWRLNKFGMSTPAKSCTPVDVSRYLETIPPGTNNRSRRKLAAAMRLKFPENCLRNSYATYALTFRSLGDVAKAMGDARPP